MVCKIFEIKLCKQALLEATNGIEQTTKTLGYIKQCLDEQ